MHSNTSSTPSSFQGRSEGSRLLSVRNLDVLTLYLPVPGLLLLLEADARGRPLLARWGYVWLLAASGYFLARCLVEVAGSQVGFQKRVLEHFPLGVGTADSHDVVGHGFYGPDGALVIASRKGTRSFYERQGHSACDGMSLIRKPAQSIGEPIQGILVAHRGEGKSRVHVVEHHPGSCRQLTG